MNFFSKFFSSKKSSTPSPTRNLIFSSFKQRGDIDHSAYSDEAFHAQTEKRKKQMPAENVGRTGRGKGGVIDRDRLKEYILKTLIPQVRVAKDKAFFWGLWKGTFIVEYNEGKEKGFECQAREGVVRFHTWERDPNARLKGSKGPSVWSYIATDKKNEGRRKGTLVLEEEALRRQADEIAGSREDANKFYGQVGRLIGRFPGENFTSPWTADELYEVIDKLKTEDAMDQATPKYMRDQLDQAKHGAGRTDEELAKEPTLADRCEALRRAGKDEEAEALMNAEADRLIEAADETKRDLGLVMHQ